jgi:hypothetical protein
MSKLNMSSKILSYDEYLKIKREYKKIEKDNEDK